MRKAVAAVVIGVFLYLVLIVIHEEWRQHDKAGWTAPPPIQPGSSLGSRHARRRSMAITARLDTVGGTATSANRSR